MRETLFGKYRLGERIARGGMAEIYLAQVVGAGGFAREIVIKRILPDLVEDEEFREMFEEEAKLAALLDHPNIVQIFDYEQHEDSFFIAMEYVRGADLAKLIRAAGERRERLTPEVVVFILTEVLAGLGYAHALTDEDMVPLGLVHRDISPANILLSYTGAVKLADFGIAKAATSMVHTSAGILKGKYPYMSPEQAGGHPVDRRSDLFSVGIVLYQALVGRRPFRGKDSAELLDNVINGRYTPPQALVPTLPRRLTDVVAKALAISPDRRFQTAEEFIQALRGSLDTTPTREQLEECIARLIPQKPRTVSLAAPAPEAAPTVRAGSTHSGSLLDVGTAVAGDTRDSAITDHTEPTLRTVEDAADVQTQASLRAGPKPRGRGPLIAALLGTLGLLLGAVVAGGAMNGWFGGDRAAPAATDAAPVARRPFTVLARRSTDQENALREHGLDDALSSRDLELRLLRFNQYDELIEQLGDAQVDLVSVPLAMAKTLARDGLIVPVDRVAKQRLSAVTSRFSPPALEVASVETPLGSNLTYIPDYLEVHVIAYRASKVALARERWTDFREGIEDALKQVNGRGLPADYSLEEDPARWDELDLFVLGYTWAHADVGVPPGPRLTLRSASYWPSVEGLIERMNRHGQRQATWRRGEPLVDVLTWLSLQREHGLLREEVVAERPSDRPTGTGVTNAFARGEAYLARVNQLRCSEIRQHLEQFQPGFTVDDIAFAPIPAGVSVELDDDGRPLRTSTRDGLVNAWLWAIPRSANDPETSLDVALEIVAVPNQTFMANFNCWIPTNTGVDANSEGQIEPFCRRSIAPGLERLTRPLSVAYPPSGEQLTTTINQFERLWTDLLYHRGYRDESGRISIEAIRELVARHVPEG